MGLRPNMYSPDNYGYRDGVFFSVNEVCPEKVMDAIVGYAKYHTDWNWLMPVVEKIHSPMRVKIYGTYRDIQGEDVNVIVHRASTTSRNITLKIEYGRRFKEFTHYKKEGETMLEPTHRFVVDFITWYNKHK
jgi:hypothetical protein